MSNITLQSLNRFILYTQIHSEKKKESNTHYDLFLSNPQHSLLKFKSLKFKCLKITEGHYEGLGWVREPMT